MKIHKLPNDVLELQNIVDVYVSETLRPAFYSGLCVGLIFGLIIGGILCQL